MKTSSMMKWSAAAAVLLGLGLAAASAAEAGQDDADQGLDGSGIRHGIRYEGCGHFDLADPDAVEAWAIDNSWRFAKWAMKLDELRANPEPAITEALSVLFPECTWPPGPQTTFGPQRVGWAEAMAEAKNALQSMDLAVAGPSTNPSVAAPWIARMLLHHALGPTMPASSRQSVRWHR